MFLGGIGKRAMRRAASSRRGGGGAGARGVDPPDDASPEAPEDAPDDAADERGGFSKLAAGNLPLDGAATFWLESGASSSRAPAGMGSSKRSSSSDTLRPPSSS